MPMLTRPDFLPGLPKWSRKTLFALTLFGICFAFAFPVLWLMLTSLRPESGVYYVHRGTEFTLGNFAEVLRDDRIVEAFLNSALIATLATVFSLLVTVSSGYMLSRFTGPASRIWFGTIYVFRCVPYISWVLPLYFVTQSWGIYDTYTGLLLPHVAVHICFFSWLMKGFFDGIDPSMEYAAMIDGCTRWGAFIRVAVPSALPAISALAVLCWLFTWNEFLFALILTGNRVPMITVVMAQFVTEMGLRWNLMAATAVMALVPAFLIALFGQKYVIRGLRILKQRGREEEQQKRGRNDAATDKTGDGGERGAGRGGRQCRRAGKGTADRLSAEPDPGCLDRDVRDLGRQERHQDRQGAEFLRRLCREDDGVADVELGSVRRDLAQ